MPRLLACAAGLALALASTSIAKAQEKGTPTARPSTATALAAARPAADFLPLAEDGLWRYRVTRDGEDGRSDAGVMTRRCEPSFELPDGRRCTQVRVERAGAVRYEFWVADEHGLLRIPAAVPGRRGAIDLQGKAEVHLARRVPAAQTLRPTAGAMLPGDQLPIARSMADHWLCFSPGLGIVREEWREGGATFVAELLSFAPGRDGTANREAHLRHELEQEHPELFDQGPPWIGWIETHEAALLTGRIAVVKSGAYSSCFYVDGAGVHRFLPGNADNLAAATTAAFGKAVPDEDVPLEDLAMLLLRTQAERCHLLRIRRVTPTASPKPALGERATRTALVEIEGGAPDGSTRRLRVLLEVGVGTASVQMTGDAEGPSATAW